MRILAIYRHYWPDATPYARLLKSILERTATEGHVVTVHAAQPSYNEVAAPLQPRRETLGGVDVRRLRLPPESKRRLGLRLVSSLYFLLRAVAHATLGRPYDLVIANGHPPILTACTLWLIHRLVGTPYIPHLQDVHPESLRAVGQVRDGRMFRLARRIDAACCRRAAKIVTLSHDMAEALVERGVDRRQIEIINNCPLPTDRMADAPLPGPLHQSATPKFLFAGNLGDFQSLDLVISAAKLLAARRLFHVVFLGAGAERERLVALAGDQLDRCIFFLPHVAPEVAVAAMGAADFGIVSLAPQVYRYAYPSKTMTYLAAGCPLVAVVEPESELAQMVTRESLGYVAAAHTPEAIAEALDRACAERDHWTADRRGALAARCSALFGQERMLAEWMRVLDSLSNYPISGPPTPQQPAQHESTLDGGPTARHFRLSAYFNPRRAALGDEHAARSARPPARRHDLALRRNQLHLASSQRALAHGRAAAGVGHPTGAKLHPAGVRSPSAAGRRGPVRDRKNLRQLPPRRVRPPRAARGAVHPHRAGRPRRRRLGAGAVARPFGAWLHSRKARFVPAADLPYYAVRYLGHRCWRLLRRDRRLPAWGPRVRRPRTLAGRAAA